jgi:hypothetical protein
LPPGGHRDRVRRAARLLAEQSVDRGIPWVRPRGGVERAEDPGPLLLADQLDLAHRQRRLRGHQLEDPPQVAAHPADRVRLEQPTVITQLRPAAGPHPQHEIGPGVRRRCDISPL